MSRAISSLLIASGSGAAGSGERTIGSAGSIKSEGEGMERLS